MKILVDQPIDASPEDAQRAFLDPDFYRSLGQLPGISAPEVRSISVGPERAHLVLGYRFSGQLNGIARSILDPERLSWAQETDVDLSTRHTDLRMVPDSYTKLLQFSGWYELRDSPSAASGDGPDTSGIGSAGTTGGAGGPGGTGSAGGTGGACTQHFEADLRVRLAVLGPLAERAIAGGIRENLAATAQLVARYIAGHPRGRT